MSDVRVQWPAGLERLPAGYRVLFEQAAKVLGRDERVRALWVSGSLARGAADAWSDLDLIASVRDADFDAVAASWREWLAAVTPAAGARPRPSFLPRLHFLSPTR